MKATHTGERRTRPRRAVTAAGVIALLVVLLAGAVMWTGCTVPGDGQTTTTGAGTETTYGAIWNGDGPGDTTVTTPAGETAQLGGDTPQGSGGSSGASASPAEHVAERLGPSVVNIAVEGSIGTSFGQQSYAGEGSGVIITSDGMIVTNNHVVSQELSSGESVQADSITVTLATGEQLPARLVGTDPLTDLAVVDVDKQGLPAAEFIDDFSKVRIGQYAVAIGSPLGYENSVTMGIVSGVFRDLPVSQASEQFALVDLIQTDAAISPGNSGGALADVEGRVIGINVAYVPPGVGAQNLAFAIPADVVKDVSTQIVQTGRVRHAFMGIRSRSITRELQQQFGLSRDKGVLVVSVDPGSPAEQAGLKQGDIIIKVDDREIVTDANLFGVLRTKKPGDVVRVGVERDGSQVDLAVTLAERPQ